MTKPTRYDVSWVDSVPKDENGDPDIDAARYSVRTFPSIGLARAFARKVIVGKFWEIATITPMRAGSAAEVKAAYDGEGDVPEWYQFKGAIWIQAGPTEEVS